MNSKAKEIYEKLSAPFKVIGVDGNEYHDLNSPKLYAPW